MNIIQLISIYMTSTSTPDICQTPLDIFQTPQTLSRHPGYRCFRVREGTGTSTEDCPLEVPVPSLTRKHLYLWCLDNVWCVRMMSQGVWQMCGGDVDVIWIENSWIIFVRFSYCLFFQCFLIRENAYSRVVWIVSGGAWMMSKGVWQMFGVV